MRSKSIAWMVEAVSYKSLHHVKQMLIRKREDKVSELPNKKRQLRNVCMGLMEDLHKDAKLLKWYASDCGFYLGTGAYYVVKARYRTRSSLFNKHLKEYKELKDDLRTY